MTEDVGIAAARAATLLGDLDVALMVPAGSRAYGLATEESDEDWRGMFVAHALDLWRLSQPAETVERKSPDIVVHELIKFCRLAIKGNPSVLEVLWTEGGYYTGVGLELQMIRKAFLWKGSLQPYLGYAQGQLWRLHHTGRPQNQGNEGADPKFGMHLHRILLAGIHLAMTGEVLVDVTKPAHPDFGNHRESLMEVRRGKAGGWTVESMTQRAQTYFSSLQKWTEKASLPEHPDTDRIEAFIADVRRRKVCRDG